MDVILTDNPDEHLVAERGCIYEDLTQFYQDQAAILECYLLDMAERLKRDKAKSKRRLYKNKNQTDDDHGRRTLFEHAGNGKF